MNSTEQSSSHRGPRPRPLLLAIPLGLLGVLLVAATVQAVMVSRLHTTLAQFDTGTFDRTGMLDIPGEGIDSVQLLPIGLVGEWSQAAPLPVALGDMATAVNDDIVYVIGGEDINQYRPEVYSARMPLSATISSWTTQTPLPEARKAAAAAVHRGSGGTSTLYVIGGIRPGFQTVNTVYRAQIDDVTGAIVGPWQELPGEQLPVPMRYPAAAVHDDYLYVIGGYHPAGSALYDTVYYTHINPDGSLDGWSTTSPLQEGVYDAVALVYESTISDTLYLIGGRNPATSTYKVFFADFLEGGNGALTSWDLSQGNLPIHVYAHDGVMINGEILLAGGIINATDLSVGISQTVKAAYVDTTNALFRLYDWCYGTPPPTCTIGAWQTGGLLPEVRAYHGVASAHGSVYVMGGKNASALVTDNVYHISMNGTGNLYSPNGDYWSEEMHLSTFPATLHNVTWDVTFGHPDDMALAMAFRYSPNGADWSPWTTPVQSGDGPNEYEFSSLPDDVRYFQYHAIFTTAISNASPLLNEVEVFYELDDPDLQVRKDAGVITTTTPGDHLLYNVYYTNSGEYVAPGTVITETVPAHTTYAGTGWQRIGTTDVYTYSLDNVSPGEAGSVPFEVDVASEIPPGVIEIVNNVEIDFQPFLDRVGATIVDPVPGDNEYTFPLPLDTAGIAITKRAVPAPGSEVSPGDHITYTLVYTNTGTRDLTQAVITDHYDPSGSYDVVQTTPPPTSGDNVWQVPDIPIGASQEIEIVVAITTTTLPDNWPVSNQASIDVAETNMVWSPVVTHTVKQPIAPRVDLVVQGLTWEPQRLLSGAPVTFHAVLANQGELAATETFWAELYVKPSPSDPPAGPSDHDYGFCLDDCAIVRQEHALDIASLGANASVTGSFENLLAGSSALLPGQYDVYVQIDTAYGSDEGAIGNPYWGVYAEADESNNIWHTTVVIEPAGYYLPMVYKTYR